jgi:hypothetical protein
MDQWIGADAAWMASWDFFEAAHLRTFDMIGKRREPTPQNCTAKPEIISYRIKNQTRGSFTNGLKLTNQKIFTKTDCFVGTRLCCHGGERLQVPDQRENQIFGFS